MNTRRETIADKTLEGLGKQLAFLVKHGGWTRGRWRQRPTWNGKTVGMVYTQDIEVPADALTRDTTPAPGTETETETGESRE